MAQELHILVGCADARDLNQVQVDAINETSKLYRSKGISIEFQVIRAAGSFLTPDVISDIKRIIEEYQRKSVDFSREISYYVHIQSHGQLTEDSSKDYVSHVYDLRIVDGSPLNCGMLHASGVGIEIEQLLVQEMPFIDLPGGRVLQIINDSDIRILLKEFYAYDGYLAGDWIKSIDLLRTHPRLQRTRLEKAITEDSELRTLDIKITSGILDYSIHALIRVDGGEPEAPWWDHVQMRIRELNQNPEIQKEILSHQNRKQTPLAGLLCMANPKMSSRLQAAQWYMRHAGHSNYDDYLPNILFNITGNSFDIPSLPFGPYVIAGFFYAVKHLGLKDQMVMGYDERQTARIIHKIKNDPLMSLIVKKYDVNLISIHQEELVHS